MLLVPENIVMALNNVMLDLSFAYISGPKHIYLFFNYAQNKSSLKKGSKNHLLEHA